MLPHFGIHEDRFLQEWVSASEGDKFTKLVTGFVDRLKRLKEEGELERPKSASS